MKHTWIVAFFGGAIFGGAIGTYAGAKIMYDRNHEAMEAVEKELNDIIFKLKENKETAADITVSEETSNEFVSYAPAEHTPAFKTSEVSVIPFDDFETEPEFESEVLFYYPESGDVTDDQYIPIGKGKLKEMIGDDALTHFDEYEEDPDCVRVRNDTLKTYYEILRYYTSP